MNVTEFTSLINTPNAINDVQCVTLEKIVQEFRYFQSARALYLKGLYNQNSFKYNYILKITAAHTTDRSVLFDFITSDTFVSVQKTSNEKKMVEILNVAVTESDIIVEKEPKLEQRINTIEESILTSIKNANATIETESPIGVVEPVIPEIPIEETEIKEKEALDEKLEIGKPLEFSRVEKHSFQEWLQLSGIQPIQREEKSQEKEEKSPEIDSEKQKKSELIDRFIETSPKIPPVKNDIPIASIVLEPHKEDNSYLMTETLARVYLEQKKYQKAIQAYEILILKYPEKISFFADRISDIKILQHNNK